MYMSGVLFAVIDLIVSLLKKLDMILTDIKNWILNTVDIAINSGFSEHNSTDVYMYISIPYKYYS